MYLLDTNICIFAISTFYKRSQNDWIHFTTFICIQEIFYIKSIII